LKNDVSRWSQYDVAMEAPTITNVLLGIIAIALLLPLVTRGHRMYKQRKARLKTELQERLRIEVEPFYQEYLQKLDALREKHDPEHKWRRHPIDVPDLPPAYRADINALTEGYKGVLVVRFGNHLLQPTKG